MKSLAAIAVVAAALTGSAAANCYHEGVTYSEGAQICSHGWLQECTPAGYFRAIGYCRADDPLKPTAFSPIGDAEAKAAGIPDVSTAPAPSD